MPSTCGRAQGALARHRVMQSRHAGGVSVPTRDSDFHDRHGSYRAHYATRALTFRRFDGQGRVVAAPSSAPGTVPARLICWHGNAALVRPSWGSPRATVPLAMKAIWPTEKCRRRERIRRFTALLGDLSQPALLNTAALVARRTQGLGGELSS